MRKPAESGSGKILGTPADISEEKYSRTKRNLILSGATANVVGMLTIGTFLTGYLQFLGASEQYIAVIAVIPQLGSILQIVSPYIFEKMRYRKVLITLSLFLFRFSAGTVIFVPYLTDRRSEQLTLIMLIYTFAFLVAGFVTPGLDHWNLQMAPEKGRGAFLARKDIFSMVTVSLVSLGISRMLDHYKAENREMTGFTIMFMVALLVSLLDFYLLTGISEKENEVYHEKRTLMETIMIPLQDKSFRRIIAFFSLWNFALQISTAFIPIYMISYLNLSYYFISVTGVVASAAGMVSIYFWGRYADKRSFFSVLRVTGIIMALSFAGWFLAGGSQAKMMVLVLQIMMTSTRGAFMMASHNILYEVSPRVGKTAYFGVAWAFAYVISFAGGILGSYLSLLMKTSRIEVFGYPVMGIQFLFLLTGILLTAALVFFRTEGTNNQKTKDK